MPVQTQTVSVDSIARVRMITDTVISRDSIVIERKGDTVFVDRVRFLREVSSVRDTLYRSVSDTVFKEIPVPVETVKEVRQLRTIDKIVWIISMSLLGACMLLYVFIKVKKRL